MEESFLQPVHLGARVPDKRALRGQNPGLQPLQPVVGPVPEGPAGPVDKEPQEDAKVHRKEIHRFRQQTNRPVAREHAEFTGSQDQPVAFEPEDPGDHGRCVLLCGAVQRVERDRASV